MPRPRSTVEIVYLKETINKRIAECDDINVRRELCTLLGNILWQANAYNGFSYIDGWNGTETYRQRFY